MARDAVAEIRDRTDIVELVRGYVPSLKKTGRTFKGLCPFHQEKTPSFIVFPDSQNFHCFGCGKGGDIFTFYMLSEHVEFREGLRELARRAGVELEPGAAPTPKQDEHRRRLVEINQLAATFFGHVLQRASAGADGRALVEQRGVSPEMVERFGLGFAPDGWEHLTNFLSSRSVDGPTGVEAGLLQERPNGGYYDRFRNRLMFPIRDRDGNVVGFGGRALGDAMPKYLNSPQTPIFDKSSLVYGLDLARDAIRKHDEVVIVEGYMDAIAAHQFGHENVVAAMGTALTEGQVAQVKRGSKRIVLALDADTAGQMATLRGLETMRDALDQDMVPIPDALGVVRFERKLNAEIAIVELPEGKDPDELIRKAPERWPEIVRRARPFLDFTLDVLVRDVGRDDARGKAEVVTRVAPLLQQIPDRIVQGHYMSQLARRLDLDERLVVSEIRRARARTSARPSEAADHPKARRRATEDHLLALLLQHHDLTRAIAVRIPPDDLLDARNRELLRILSDPAIAGLTAEQVVAGLDDQLADHAEALLSAVEGQPEQFPGHVQRAVTQMLDTLGRERFVFLARQIQSNIEAAAREDDTEAVDSLRGQLSALADRHRQLYPPPSPYFRDSRSPQGQHR
ncbi:MAG: DNA primase [Chloroflexia bacterium]|nr:DNA primase [Chloroflexia bacterium]